LFRLFALFQFLLALFPASFILFLLAPFPARLFLFLLLMFMCRSSLFVVMLAAPHRRRFVLGVCYCVVTVFCFVLGVCYCRSALCCFLVLVVVVDLGDRCLLLRRGLGGGLLLW
jgi:hypothetical protein